MDGKDIPGRSMLIWEFPKTWGPKIDTTIVGLLSKGHPTKSTLNFWKHSFDELATSDPEADGHLMRL